MPAARSPGYPSPLLALQTFALFALSGIIQKGQEYIRVSGRYPSIPVSSRTHAPEAVIVVAVVRRVVVAISTACVVRVVVPTAAPQHTVRVSGYTPFGGYYILAKGMAVCIPDKFKQW